MALLLVLDLRGLFFERFLDLLLLERERLCLLRLELLFLERLSLLRLERLLGLLLFLLREPLFERERLVLLRLVLLRERLFLLRERLFLLRERLFSEEPEACPERLLPRDPAASSFTSASFLSAAAGGEGLGRGLWRAFFGLVMTQSSFCTASSMFSSHTPSMLTL